MLCLDADDQSVDPGFIHERVQPRRVEQDGRRASGCPYRWHWRLWSASQWFPRFLLFLSPAAIYCRRSLILSTPARAQPSSSLAPRERLRRLLLLSPSLSHLFETPPPKNITCGSKNSGAIEIFALRAFRQRQRVAFERRTWGRPCRARYRAERAPTPSPRTVATSTPSASTYRAVS